MLRRLTAASRTNWRPPLKRRSIGPPRVSRRIAHCRACGGVVAAAAVAVVVGQREVAVQGGSPCRAELGGRVDAGTGKLVASVPVGSGPVRIAAGAGALWVANRNAGTVSRIDPGAKAAVQTIEVGSGPAGIAFGNGAVWVANASDGTLSRINADTNTDVQTIRVCKGHAASPTARVPSGLRRSTIVPSPASIRQTAEW